MTVIAIFLVRKPIKGTELLCECGKGTELLCEHGCKWISL